MLNAATSKAMTANAVRAVRTNPRKLLLIALMFSCASWAPVIAWTPGGRTARSRVMSWPADTPGAGLIKMLLSWPGLLVR